MTHSLQSRNKHTNFNLKIAKNKKLYISYSEVE